MSTESGASGGSPEPDDQQSDKTAKPATSTPAPSASDPTDKAHLGGLIVAMTGIIGLLIVFVVTMFHYGTGATRVATALSAVTGTVGTIVGAYFGVQVGSASGDKATAAAEKSRAASDKERAQTQDKALKLAAASDPEVALRILGVSPLTPNEAPTVARKAALKTTAAPAKRASRSRKYTI